MLVVFFFEDFIPFAKSIFFLSGVLNCKTEKKTHFWKFQVETILSFFISVNGVH